MLILLAGMSILTSGCNEQKNIEKNLTIAKKLQSDAYIDQVSADSEKRTKAKTVCVQGYVLKGGDKTHAELKDSPRHFNFSVVSQSGEFYNVNYRALPPSPARVKLNLKFYAGSVKKYDYMKACGRSDETQKIVVDKPEHSITTYPTTLYYIVRHAEKASDAPNTNLSQQGLIRAVHLSTIAENSSVNAIYVSSFCRTAQTGQATAQLLNLPLHVFSPANTALDGCDPDISVPLISIAPQFNNSAAISGYLLANIDEGSRILIVGHNNTVPQLVEAISGKSPCPGILMAENGVCTIPENEFNHLFVIVRRSSVNFGYITHSLY